MIGQCVQESGKKIKALFTFNEARKHALPEDHPDQALPYAYMGACFLEPGVDEPIWATRCFLLARQIREAFSGRDSIDTATIYNNLGVCMFSIQRFAESIVYFELAHAIIECHLGSEHE